MSVAALDARPRERDDPRPRPRRAPRRRVALLERLTVNVVVGLIAALLAFVLAASLLSDRREMMTVAVARETIAAGTPIESTLVTSTRVPADVGFAGALVEFDRIASGTLNATRTLQAGEPLTASAVGDAGSVSGQRVMSIRVERWQAANGDIEVGDQVDVMVTTKDVGSRYVLTAAAVVGRSSGAESGGLVNGARSGEFVISLEVDAAQALELAAAIESGSITVLRSTGAPPVAASVVGSGEADR